MPKGVLWRQHDIYMSAMGGRNILTQATVESYDDVAAAARMFAEPLRFLVLPPLMHGAAQWVSFIGLNGGHAIVLPPDTRRLDPAQTWRTVERERCSTLTVVGDAIARPLVEELEAGSYDTSSLLSVGNGGAPLTPTIKERLLARLPSIMLTDSVGSSETGAQMSHVSATGGEVSTGRFTPLPGTVVVSEDLDKVLGPGHEGIGWLAQEGWVPLGYLGDEDKTARTFPVIGGTRYSVPGDRARHLNGDIELLGRDSVTINSGGEKIFAEEVERAIAGHPAVHDVVVVGQGQRALGPGGRRPGGALGRPAGHGGGHRGPRRAARRALQAARRTCCSCRPSSGARRQGRLPLGQGPGQPTRLTGRSGRCGRRGAAGSRYRRGWRGCSSVGRAAAFKRMREGSSPSTPTAVPGVAWSRGRRRRPAPLGRGARQARPPAIEHGRRAHPRRGSRARRRTCPTCTSTWPTPATPSSGRRSSRSSSRWRPSWPTSTGRWSGSTPGPTAPARRAGDDPDERLAAVPAARFCAEHQAEAEV